MLWTLITHPHLIYGTLSATVEASLQAEKIYGKTHWSNGMGNAYKHALWSLFIAQKNQWAFRTEEQSTTWARRITDLHEKCFPNDTANSQMDKQNNQIGLALYRRLYQKNNGRPGTQVILQALSTEQLVTLS